MSRKTIFVGTDVGASRTKVAVLDAEKNLAGWSVKRSGTDFSATAEECLTLALKKAGAERTEMAAAALAQIVAFGTKPARIKPNFTGCKLQVRGYSSLIGQSTGCAA